MDVSRRSFVRNVAVGSAGALCLGIKTNAFPAKSLVIDSHCHAWDYWPYSPEVPDPKTRGTVEQLINQMDLHGVDQATIVSAQIDHNPSNNLYVADAVKKYQGRLHQFADVDSVWSSTYHTPGAARRMEDVVKKFNPKGFTHYLSEEDDASWLNSRDGIDFLSVASEAKLIFSVASYPVHQPALRKVAERFPSMPILCHHMSGLKAYGADAKQKLDEVLMSSEYPNIFLKLSGFAYLSDKDKKYEYPYTDTQWIFKACYEKYGVRMVWGSDYPVVNFFMTYQQSLEAFRKHLSFIAEEHRSAILGGTLGKFLSR